VAIPYTACLLACRHLFAGQPGMVLLTGLASGGGVLIVLYWCFVLPPAVRAKVRRRLRSPS
jgi:hypothetical protein